MRKLLGSCTGSHSNAVDPIFKNLKDSKNIKSEGKKKKKKKKALLSGKGKSTFLTASSNKTINGSPSIFAGVQAQNTQSHNTADPEGRWLFLNSPLIC